MHKTPTTNSVVKMMVFMPSHLRGSIKHGSGNETFTIAQNSTSRPFPTMLLALIVCAVSLVPASALNFFNFTGVDIDGLEVPFSTFAGGVTMVVNVASFCGHTETNYRELQELHEKLHGDGLEILAFPCNQFKNQEPKSHEEIKVFAAERHAAFRLFSKVQVNGPSANPLYTWLKANSPQNHGDVKWNFEKFLINRDGEVVARYMTKVDPHAIEADLRTLLKGATTLARSPASAGTVATTTTSAHSGSRGPKTAVGQQQAQQQRQQRQKQQQGQKGQQGQQGRQQQRQPANAP